jgi:hypothetical protein
MAKQLQRVSVSWDDSTNCFSYDGPGNGVAYMEDAETLQAVRARLTGAVDCVDRLIACQAKSATANA